MDPRRLDAAAAQEPLQRQLDEFLRFAHDVGPAAALVERVDRAEPQVRAADVVACKFGVVHRQTTSVQ